MENKSQNAVPSTPEEGQNIFDRDDLLRMTNPESLHSNGTMKVIDSGDLCDADCLDCD